MHQLGHGGRRNEERRRAIKPEYIRPHINLRHIPQYPRPNHDPTHKLLILPMRNQIRRRRRVKCPRLGRQRLGRHALKVGGADDGLERRGRGIADLGSDVLRWHEDVVWYRG